METYALPNKPTKVFIHTRFIDYAMHADECSHCESYFPCGSYGNGSMCIESPETVQGIAVGLLCLPTIQISGEGRNNPAMCCSHNASLF